jgi:hypothetical protein
MASAQFTARWHFPPLSKFHRDKNIFFVTRKIIRFLSQTTSREKIINCTFSQTTCSAASPVFTIILWWCSSFHLIFFCSSAAAAAIHFAFFGHYGLKRLKIRFLLALPFPSFMDADGEPAHTTIHEREEKIVCGYPFWNELWKEKRFA